MHTPVNLQIINIFTLLIVCSSATREPEQIHLSLGRSVEEMTVTWLTNQSTSASVVEYSSVDQLSHLAHAGLVPLRPSANFFKLSATGSSEKHTTDDEDEPREMYIHRVTLKSLKAGTRYYYRVGSKDSFSKVFFFDSLKSGTNWSPKVVIYGDFGFKNGRIQDHLKKQISASSADLIIHIGDFAYDLHSDNARVGDAFLRRLEDIAAYVPYQTVPGNHESHRNFTEYDARFTMINSDGGKNNHFYSFNVGPIHFVGFSTEFYFYLNYGSMQITNQYNWLENDLKEANKPENRATRPWIVTLGHRPMYCTMNDNSGCRKTEKTVRYGLFTPKGNEFGLEDLFYRYGVDVSMFAHEHAYERFWPLYNAKVYNGSTEEPYTNPTAPVHFIVGAGGCREGLYAIKDRPSDIAAARFSQFGFAHLTAINRSHLTIQQYTDDTAGKIIDKVTIIKTNHGAYPDRARNQARPVQPSTKPNQSQPVISKPKDITSDSIAESAAEHNPKENLSASSDSEESSSKTPMDRKSQIESDETGQDQSMEQ